MNGIHTEKELDLVGVELHNGRTGISGMEAIGRSIHLV